MTKEKTLAILGLGGSLQEFFSDSLQYHPRIDTYLNCDEIWSLNKGIRYLPGDQFFILDDLVGEARKSSSYHQAITECDKPIITSILDADVLDLFPRNILIEYPLHYVLLHYGRYFYSQSDLDNISDEDAVKIATTKNYDSEYKKIVNYSIHVGAYLHNSIPMMLAYAGFEGFTKIYLFGVDYTYPGMPANVGEAGRSNCEYWIGLLRGMGVKVIVSSDSTLLDAREGVHFYGYGKRQPVINHQSLTESLMIQQRQREKEKND